MKKNDLAILISAIILSAIISILISKFVFPTNNRQQQVDIVPPISSRFPKLDPSYFNSKSIDPTQFIVIGNSANPSPFNSNSSGL